MTHFLIAYGRPAPQGSKDPLGISKKTGKFLMKESSPHVKPWRQDVAVAAREYIRQYLANLGPGHKWEPITYPIIARMVFTLAKPKSAPKTIRIVPSKYPDATKLARSTEDALVQAGLIKDDALIVDFSRQAKVYPGEDPEALEAPGVQITIDNYFDAPIHPSLVCQKCGGFRPTHKCTPGALLTTAAQPHIASPLLNF